MTNKFIYIACIIFIFTIALYTINALARILKNFVKRQEPAETSVPTLQTEDVQTEDEPTLDDEDLIRSIREDNPSNRVLTSVSETPSSNNSTELLTTEQISEAEIATETDSLVSQTTIDVIITTELTTIEHSETEIATETDSFDSLPTADVTNTTELVIITEHSEAQIATVTDSLELLPTTDVTGDNSGDDGTTEPCETDGGHTDGVYPDVAGDNTTYDTNHKVAGDHTTYGIQDVAGDHSTYDTNPEVAGDHSTYDTTGDHTTSCDAECVNGDEHTEPFKEPGTNPTVAKVTEPCESDGGLVHSNKDHYHGSDVSPDTTNSMTHDYGNVVHGIVPDGSVAGDSAVSPPGPIIVMNTVFDLVPGGVAIVTAIPPSNVFTSTVFTDEVTTTTVFCNPIPTSTLTEFGTITQLETSTVIREVTLTNTQVVATTSTTYLTSSTTETVTTASTITVTSVACETSTQVNASVATITETETETAYVTETITQSVSPPPASTVVVTVTQTEEVLVTDLPDGDVLGDSASTSPPCDKEQPAVVNDHSAAETPPCDTPVEGGVINSAAETTPCDTQDEGAINSAAETTPCDTGDVAPDSTHDYDTSTKVPSFEGVLAGSDTAKPHDQLGIPYESSFVIPDKSGIP